MPDYEKPAPIDAIFDAQTQSTQRGQSQIRPHKPEPEVHEADDSSPPSQYDISNKETHIENIFDGEEPEYRTDEWKLNEEKWRLRSWLEPYLAKFPFIRTDIEAQHHLRELYYTPIEVD